MDNGLTKMTVSALLFAVLYASCRPCFAETAGPSSWQIAFSPSMPSHLSRSGGAYHFDFPNSSRSVHYVIQRATALSVGQTLTMVFALQGNGKLLPTEGRSAAQVRLFLQRQGDTFTANEPYKRWWSLAHVILLSPGTFRLSAKIDPSGWSSVFGAVGTTSPTEFADCISNLANWGFTFGGDFAGHGVYAKNGKIRFILKEFSVSSSKS